MALARNPERAPGLSNIAGSRRARALLTGGPRLYRDAALARICAPMPPLKDLQERANSLERRFEQLKESL